MHFRRTYAVGVAAVLLGALVAQVAMAGNGQPPRTIALSESQLREIVRKEVARQGTAQTSKTKKKKKKARPGPAGPQGPAGAQGPAGPPGSAANVTLEPVQKITGTSHFDCANILNRFCLPPGPGTEGWKNYGAGYAEVGYYKDAFGIVHLQGVALVGNSTCNPTCGPIFYLPPGYRPTDGTHQAATFIAGNVFGYVDILTNGAVWPGPGQRLYAALDGISFRTD
jgi:hypothetical protein